MDIKTLAAELGLEEKEALRLVQTFVEATEQDLLLLEQALADQDTDQVIKLVHHIKGAASNLELTPIIESARSIEQGARSHMLEDTEAQIAAMRSKLESIRGEMVVKD